MFGRYIRRRLLHSAFVLWLAATLTFLAFYFIPGDPAQVLLAASGASPAEVAQRRAELGLDASLPAQYGHYLLALAQGDLGQSWLHSRSVALMISEQLPPTVELALAAMLIGIILGFTLGIGAAIRRGTWLDLLATSLAVIGLSTPTYWSGLLAILFFSLYLRWLPATGNGGVQHLILPAATLGFALSGSIARLVRASVIEVMSQPYVLAAHARGITPRLVLFGHILRPAIAPTVTLIALQVGFLLGGAVITESVFARQGLGKLAIEAILWRDLPVIRGVVILGAMVYVLVNLLADLAQAWLNPRVRNDLA